MRFYIHTALGIAVGAIIGCVSIQTGHEIIGLAVAVILTIAGGEFYKRTARNSK